jgi:hypothetical protein
MPGSRTVSLICKGSRAHLPLRPTVEEALNAVSERNIIFGGLEIVALTAIGAFVFTSVQSGGAHATRRNHIGLAVGNRARIEAPSPGTITHGFRLSPQSSRVSDPHDSAPVESGSLGR